MKLRFILLFTLLSSVIFCQNIQDTLKLEVNSKFNSEIIDESSGIIKSRTFENVFWTLNDSGDDAIIYPFNLNGETIKPKWQKEFKGIEIVDAANIDWEDIAIDDNGNLIIGACGNNGSIRKDLAIYLVKEPNPYGVPKTRYFQKIPFVYPDQKEFPDPNYNFDCEAVFYANEKIYFLTKHRTNTKTRLYELSTFKQNEINELKFISEFEIKGMVTAADFSEDRRMLAVLCYTNVWLFEIDETNNFLAGENYSLPISAKQCESICFDEENLVITNEQQEIFVLEIEKLKELSLK